MPSGAERWPTGAHKDVLVPMWESHCLQAPNIQADLQRNWCIPPPELHMSPAPASGQLKKEVWWNRRSCGVAAAHTCKVSQQMASENSSQRHDHGFASTF